MTIPNIATFDHGTYSWFVFSIPYLELILTTAHLPKPKRESVVLSEFEANKVQIIPWIFNIPRDPGSPSENGSMEPKYYAFWRWLDTPCSSSEK